MPVGKIHLECSPGVMENRNHTLKKKDCYLICTDYNSI